MNRHGTEDARHTNHLIEENSPYLLSHAHNPVDWYPWGEEALTKARAEDKVIFLSIGYAACHWCHVMERESFESQEIADILNRSFVSIKVDREQRPDLDQIYMAFTTALTGGGGWPMSVFLTPDRKPFFAGTYFPPEDYYGRPGFKRVLTEIASVYQTRKETIVESAQRIFDAVSEGMNRAPGQSILRTDMISRSVTALKESFDDAYGGFGTEPKFPHALELSLFFRHYRKSGDIWFREAAEKALSAMARGGIYDHLGGGFARYATDRRWLVPHFEKMLYDNALLVPVYVEAYQLSQEKRYRQVVRETLDFILRELADAQGGFCSALDADSESVEGKFYVWDKSEIQDVLGDKAELFCDYFNVTDQGNWEGKNILNLDTASDRVRQEAPVDDFEQFLADAKEQLLRARDKRVRPLTDDKILVSWNGLALSALCKGYQATGEVRYLEAAIKNATFVQSELYRNGHLMHTYRDGRRSAGEFLEDYSFYVRGLLDLFETDLTGGHRWLALARELARRAVDLFMSESGEFFLRPDKQEDLIVRPRDESDGAIPAPGSLMIGSLLKLHRITGERAYLVAGEKALRALSTQIERFPSAMASAVIALDYYASDKLEIVIVGDGSTREGMVREVYRRYLPNKILAVSADGSAELPLFEGRNAARHEATAYVCRNSACRLPALTADELEKQLDEF